MTRLASSILLAGTALLAGPLAAHAKPSKPPPVDCTLNDVNLTIGATTYQPVQCASNVSTGASDPTTETAALNTVFSEPAADPLVFLAKDDGTQETLDGIQFGLSAVTLNPAKTMGTWTISWTDVDGAAPDNLPITLDLAVLISGGNNADAYLFDNLLLPVTPDTGTGNFQITFLNNGGQVPGLSHMIIAGNNDAEVHQQCTTDCTSVPEPMSAALLSVGLLGTLAAARYRRG